VQISAQFRADTGPQAAQDVGTTPGRAARRLAQALELLFARSHEEFRATRPIRVGRYQHTVPSRKFVA
jgi:hypothetical protein